VRRRLSAIATLALGIACTVAAPAAPGRAPSPTAVGIAEREFRIGVYRTSVVAGAVKLNVQNLGEDVHNLVVSGPGGYSAAVPDIRSGGRASVVLHLNRRGVYRLLCTRANHLQLGMRSSLRVVRRRR